MRSLFYCCCALLLMPMTHTYGVGNEKVISSPAAVGPTGKRKLFPACQANQYLTINLTTGNPMCKDFTPCAANQYVSTNSVGAMICRTIPACSGTNQFLTFQSNNFVCGQVVVNTPSQPFSLFGGGAAGSYGNGNQSGNNTTGNSAGDR